LDFKKIIERPENLVVIEWADKVKSLIPKNAVWVKFEWAGKEERKIEIKSPKGYSSLYKAQINANGSTQNDR